MEQQAPYAVLSYNNEVLNLDKRRFSQAVADGKRCRCNTCLACRAAEYAREMKNQGEQTI